VLVDVMKATDKELPVTTMQAGAAESVVEKFNVQALTATVPKVITPDWSVPDTEGEPLPQAVIFGVPSEPEDSYIAALHNSGNSNRAESRKRMIIVPCR
jgi:hypothetical protein